MNSYGIYYIKINLLTNEVKVLLTLFLILFLKISIKSESILEPYNIDRFRNTMEKNGLYEIIRDIKIIYGQDVAIISF